MVSTWVYSMSSEYTLIGFMSVFILASMMNNLRLAKQLKACNKFYDKSIALTKAYATEMTEIGKSLKESSHVSRQREFIIARFKQSSDRIEKMLERER